MEINKLKAISITALRGHSITLKTKVLRKAFALVVLIAHLCAIGNTYAMDNGDNDYQAFLKAKKKYEAVHYGYSRSFKHDAKIMAANLEAGAKKGHPDCQYNLIYYYNNGLWGEKDAVIPIDTNKAKDWEEKYNSNTRNPLYGSIQERLKKEKQEQEERKAQEPLRLQLELEQAKIRKMELELQLAQSKNQQQAHHYPNQPRNSNNNLERNIRIADAMINTVNDGVNLYNNFQGGNDYGGGFGN